MAWRPILAPPLHILCRASAPSIPLLLLDALVTRSHSLRFACGRCVCVTPKSFKSCSNCKVQQLYPTTMRPNHEFCCPCAPSAGFRKPG